MLCKFLTISCFFRILPKRFRAKITTKTTTKTTTETTTKAATKTTTNYNKNNRQSQYLLVLDLNKNLKNPFTDSIFIMVPSFFLFLQYKKKKNQCHILFHQQTRRFCQVTWYVLMKVTY